MRMIDFLKATTENQSQINKLFDFAKSKLTPRRPQNNYYLAFSNGSGRFRLEFRKVMRAGKLIGFRNAEFCFAPHYLFNNDLHNGNDFTPDQCIEVITSAFSLLGISKNDLKDFSVVNIEYGLNLRISDVPDVVNGIFYTNRTPFITNEKMPTFKISKSSKHKEIKAYDKGAQFRDRPMYKIGEMFRFEVKTKKTRFIKLLGIENVSVLLNIKKYDLLFQSILNEWEKILIVNTKIKDEVNSHEFWRQVLMNKNRNRFGIEKENYYKKISQSDNLHRSIKLKIIDKINFLQGVQIPHSKYL